MSKTPVQLQDISVAQQLDASDIVYLPKISAPFTTVVNRAKMVDLANDMSVRMGIDRIPVQQMMRVDGEAGPNGEVVWKPVNDKFDQIRFVGNFSSVNNRVVRSVTSSILSTYIPGIKYTSFEILSASTSSLFFHPGGNQNSRSQANGVRLDYYKVDPGKQSFSFMPKKNGVDGTVYRSGINGPLTNGGTLSNRLLATFDITVRLYK
jgi:hypothetical protein